MKSRQTADQSHLFYEFRLGGRIPGAWLHKVLTGYLNYHAVPLNVFVRSPPPNMIAFPALVSPCRWWTLNGVVLPFYERPVIFA
jgi:hypothetical protein